MADEKKIPRLGKAAGEFNVAISSIISLFKKKKIEIEENPNTKLTPEMYDILLKEYQSDKMVKEESKKLDIGTFSKSKESEEVKYPEEESHAVLPVTPKPPVEEKPVEKIITTISAPKVVGKIDLEPKKVVEKNAQAKPVKSIIEKIPDEPAISKEKTAPKPEHIETVVEDLSKKIVEIGRAHV